MMKRLAVTCLAVLTCSVASSAPLEDLSAGPTGRIEFMASNPPHRWGLIRGRLGDQQVIWGDLIMPPSAGEKAPVVVMSHGSDGITEGMHQVWAKPMLAAGFAVFVVDSFTPRDSAKIAGTAGQLTWNTTVNISDAIYALKILATHPMLDASRIFHIGWSRGGNAVTGAMWPNYRQPITGSDSIKWAGSIAVYPGCNFRYKNPMLKISAPVLYLLAEKDDMTPAQPCVEEAQLLAAEGNPITHKVLDGAHHVFDRLNQPWKKGREGTYADCALDVIMPVAKWDATGWGPGLNRKTNKVITTPAELDVLVKECATTKWVTIESNARAREEAVKLTIEFLKRH